MRLLLLLPLVLVLSQCAQPPQNVRPPQPSATENASTQQVSHAQAAEQARARGDWERFILESETLWRQKPDAQRAAIEAALWSQLKHLPTQTLAQLSASPHPHVRAWADLVDFIGTTPCCPEQMARDLKWLYPHALYHHHLLKALVQKPAPPHHLAVLLPQQGRFAPIAQSIRAGMIKALYRQNSQNLLLSFYDTHQRDALQRSYRALLSQPTDALIGPLLPDNIAWLSQRANLPAWLLNNRANGYGFSLHYTRSNEIPLLIDRLTQLNATRIGIFSEQTPASQHITQKLQHAWLQVPEHAAIVAHYDLNPRKIRYTFDHLLHIDQSKARKNVLQRRLGHPLAFQPRPRQDLQAIVIATQPKIAAVINPLRDFYGLKIPVLGTSLLMQEDLHPAPIVTQDLKHIPFPGMPVYLHPGPYTNRLEAYGADALWLATHSLRHGQCANRLTGRLGFDEQGNLIRRLIWLQYRSNGTLTRAGDTP